MQFRKLAVPCKEETCEAQLKIEVEFQRRMIVGAMVEDLNFWSR